MTINASDQHLGNVRTLYRTYLAKYLIFRALKFAVLRVYFTVRNLVIAFRTLSRPRIFYRTYLARFRVFRLLKKLLLLIYFKYPIVFTRISLLLRKNGVLRLLPMQEFKVQKSITSLLIAPATTYEISGPKFVGTYPIELHRAETVTIDMPPIEAVVIPKATVVGGTNLIICDSQAIHPDLLVPTRDVIRAELFGVASVDLSSEEIRLPLPRRARRTGRAISLLGQCTGNYAHWLTETLPKLVIADTLKEFDGLPLLIDEWIHPNFRASLELLGSSKRSMIEVGLWEAVTLPGVVEITPPSYIPFESRSYVSQQTVPKPDPQIFAYSKIALGMLRDSAHAAASSYKTKSRRKLYLSRPSKSVGNSRFVVNLAEVERLIYAHGFEAIDPAELSFTEQIAVFRDANCIISPVGAALTSAIFTPAGCKIIALAPYYENASYYFFSNLMGALGHGLRYVLGPQVKTTGGHIAHQNYSIDLDALREALECFAR